MILTLRNTWRLLVFGTGRSSRHCC